MRAELGRKTLKLDDDAITALQESYWAGNVRQLKITMDKVGYVTDESAELITRRDVVMWLPKSTNIPPRVVPAESGGMALSSDLFTLPLKEATARHRDAFQHIYCKKLIEDDRNVAQAAAHAGYTLPGFEKLLVRVGLSVPSSDP